MDKILVKADSALISQILEFTGEYWKANGQLKCFLKMLW